VDCLEDALREHGKPEVFNSDQGSQFTSEVYTDVLKHGGIAISMDGQGRAYDNIFVERLWRSVKHEDVYLNGYLLARTTAVARWVVANVLNKYGLPIISRRSSGTLRR